MKIAIMLDRFGHDVSGNPVARHTVYSYANDDQPLDAPTKLLYQTRTRQQVGYGNARDDWAGTALERARVRGAVFKQQEGDRSCEEMWLIYST